MEEKEFPRNYEPSVVEVLEALSLTGDGKNLKVIGSASLRRVQYAGDYDANEVSNEHISVIAKQLGDVIRRLKKIPHLVIGDIKCGERRGVPIRWTPAQIEAGGQKGLTLEDALRAGGRSKIDTLAVVQGGRYVEIGCVYLYGRETKPPSEKELKEQLEKDMEERLEEKDYWKALKRLFSIARLVGDEKRGERLTDLFNGDLGRLYTVVSDITTLEYLLERGAGSADIIGEEISGFKARLANIWSLPEFIKAEPGFDKALDKAAEKPRAALTLLKRLKGRFDGILQGEAKDILHKEVRGTGKA